VDSYGLNLWGITTLEIGNDATMTRRLGRVHDQVLKQLIFRSFRQVETNET
jgi:hypothetical protein